MNRSSVAKHYWQSPYVQWRKEISPDCDLLLLYMRVSRQKARVIAVIETLRVLKDLKAVALVGGPLADKKGVFWITTPRQKTLAAITRFPSLGYTRAVDQAVPVSEGTISSESTISDVSWRGVSYKLKRVYEEDPKQILEESPDRRAFVLEKEGKLTEVRGYRGDGRDLNRRALPVADARLLVNLVTTVERRRFLDPFAGAGGIVVEAIKRGLDVTSVDIDPVLKFGLEALGARHYVENAGNLPFPDESFDAIATEPPYHSVSKQFLGDAFREMYRVLAFGGDMAILCADWQAVLIRRLSNHLMLNCYLDSPINRKGLNVTILAWHKAVPST